MTNNLTPSLIRSAMLEWYDLHRRDLPWRAKNGGVTDPYVVWLSEIMLQQTTVQAVKPYFEKFLALWPDIYSLANADREDVLKQWAGLGYYSRARNLHACARVVSGEYKGIFPNDVKTLKSLPGIGDYTAAAIRSIAFDCPATVIDGNIERIVSRLYKIAEPLPEGKKNIRAASIHLFEGDNVDRPSCFAQSLMDLGSSVCTPKKPKCCTCPLSGFCDAHQEKEPEKYPVRAKKKPTPEKHAVAYIYIDKGKVSIQTRPEKGMLAGMKGFPCSEWVDIAIPLDDSRINKKLFIRHVFTHFALTLYPVIISTQNEDMIDYQEVDEIGLPSLFQKLWNLVKSTL